MSCSNIWLYFWAAASVVNLISLIGREKAFLEGGSKLLLIPLLYGFVGTATGLWVSFVTAALALGWLGDLFLLNRSRAAFAAGALAFLAGHIVYIAGILIHGPGLEASAGLLSMGWPLAGLLFLYLMGLLYYAALGAVNLGWLRYVVLLYILVIMTMAGSAIVGFSSAKSPFSWMVPAGAVFFVFSDALLGVHAFLRRRRCLLPAVMAFYGVGQMLLALGLAGYLSSFPQEIKASSRSVEIDRSSHGSLSEDADTLRLVFAGDLMAHDINYRTENYREIYQGVKRYIAWGDYAFVNLEFPIIEDQAYSSYPRFNVKREYVEAAIGAGFNRFSLANNHSCDYGEAGIRATRRSQEILEARYPVLFSGLRERKGGELKPVEWYWRNSRIGFLAITEFLNDYRGSSWVNRCFYHNESKKEELLRQVAVFASKYDLFILSFHGGVEYARQPLPAKRAFFSDLLGLGVDVIWAHHPHVLQPWAVTDRGAIIFSAGNFVSGQTVGLSPSVEPGTIQTHKGDSALFCMELKRAPGGREDSHRAIPWKIVWSGAVPISHYYHPDKGMLVGKTGDLARETDGGWSDYYRERGKRIRRQLLQIRP